jgi:hypothetical protein
VLVLLLTAIITTLPIPSTADISLLIIFAVKATITTIIVTAELATHRGPQPLLILLHLISAQLCCH